MSEIPSDQAHTDFKAAHGKTANKKDTYEIRTHHTFLYQMTEIYSPRELAEDLLEGIKKAYASSKKEKINYANDVVEQNSTKQLTQHYEATKKVWEDFLVLPDDHPVDIIVGQEDELCRSTCAIRKHCNLANLKKDFGGVENIVELEEHYMDLFIQRAAEKNIPENEITIVPDIANFSDTEPIEVRRLQTTAGTLKSILAITIYG